MPETDPRLALQGQLAAIMQDGDTGTDAGRAAVAASQVAAVENSVATSAAQYERVVKQRCERTHRRSKVHPCPDCQQRISIVQTVQKVLFPPSGMPD